LQHLLFLQAVSRRYVNLHNASYDWEREKGRERERERESGSTVLVPFQEQTF